jgi:hypothetical protein
MLTTEYGEAIIFNVNPTTLNPGHLFFNWHKNDPIIYYWPVRRACRNYFYYLTKNRIIGDYKAIYIYNT